MSAAWEEGSGAVPGSRPPEPSVNFHEIAETQIYGTDILNSAALLRLTLNKYAQSLDAEPPTTTDEELLDLVALAQALTASPSDEDQICIEMLGELVEDLHARLPTPLSTAQHIARLDWQNKATRPLVLATQIWIFDRDFRPDQLPTNFQEKRAALTQSRKQLRRGFTIVSY